jgi:hypothetical protein
MAAADEAIAVNTGPLIALSACDAVGLLTRLHDPVSESESLLVRRRRVRTPGSADHLA